MRSSIVQAPEEAVGGGCSWILVYEDIISVENLLLAWREFVKGKRNRVDVQDFGRNLMSHILSLHADLKAGTYRHDGYEHFKITDPKLRDIHKANVRDRLLHHALYRKLYPFFDRTFIADSYSCRLGKGTYKAMNCFRAFARKISQNDARACWVLKCDVRRFFASIDQDVLIEIVDAYISDKRICALIGNIINSFNSGTRGKGLPLGNLTSQLLVNIYMNEFDQFMKHKMKAKYYIRYADDFVVLSRDKNNLFQALSYMEVFLSDRMKLTLHPDKVSVERFTSGVDFLGWIHFSDHCVLRMRTKRRMLRRIKDTEGKGETIQSYLGLLSHGNGYKLRRQIIG